MGDGFLERLNNEIENIEKELLVLNEKRIDMLSVLKNTDTMEKFKELEKEVINFKTKIDLLFCEPTLRMMVVFYIQHKVAWKLMDFFYVYFRNFHSYHDYLNL